MGKIYSESTNPKQYDSLEVNWKEDIDSPFRKQYYNELRKYSNIWKNSDVLEIGCGSGWLMELIKNSGAKRVEGIEPAEKNFKIANNRGNFVVHKIRFEDFESKNRFNLIISVMVFSHIKDLDKAFGKLRKLLNKNGKIMIIIPDYEYFLTPRFNYKIDVEKINKNECVAKIDRGDGTISDILRKVEFYKKQAENHDLRLVEDIELYPTPEILRKFPKYFKLKNICREHLLVFESSRE